VRAVPGRATSPELGTLGRVRTGVNGQRGTRPARVSLKAGRETVENRDMPLTLTLLLSLVLSTGSASSTSLPRGNDQFRLGMVRAQVDSAVATRRLNVITDDTAYLVCGSDDPAIEFEQYTFFLPPHGEPTLWKVTLGYRLEYSRTDLDSVRARLARKLGEPSSDSDDNVPPTDAYGNRPMPAERQVTWVDAATSVRLGGRWNSEPDRKADRMLVTWTDRHIQRLIEARRKKDKAPQP
jgi:hypothetical protein